MGFIEIVEKEETFQLKIGESLLTLRRFDSAVYKEIEKEHTTNKKNYRTGVMSKEVDEYAVNLDLLDHMIVGWQHIKSPTTGEDVPCDKKTKGKLPGTVKLKITEACDSDSITIEKKTSSNSDST